MYIYMCICVYACVCIYIYLTLEQCWGLGYLTPCAVENMDIIFDSPQNLTTNSVLLTRNLIINNI